MTELLNRIGEAYNKTASIDGLEPAGKVSNDTLTDTDCTVTGFLESTYQKYPDFFS
jgi:hypothetical protein